MSKVLAIIPAMSGSKSVPHKNIRMIAGKPMLAYSIEHALNCPKIERVIVSTDSEEYAEIAKSYGAEVPFNRPAELAQDTSLDIEVFLHALTYLKEYENYIPDIVVHLRPTYPIRDNRDIENMIEMLERDETADSVRGIVRAKETPYKMWRLEKDGEIKPLLKDFTEAYNMPRQALPCVYSQNACIDVVRSQVIIQKHSMTGEKILGYPMEHNYDIDTEDEFRNTTVALGMKSGGQKFVFDIDGVIAKFNPKLKYDEAEPDKENIQIINHLYERGNYIVLHTARGYTTGVDWQEITKNQMAEWGVRYHELQFGKPDAALYIDDKGISIWEFREIYKRLEKNYE